MADNGSINVESVNIKIESEEAAAAAGAVTAGPQAATTSGGPPPHKICSVSWVNQDEDLGSYILGLMQSL